MHTDVNGGAVLDANPMGMENAFGWGMRCSSRLDPYNMHTDVKDFKFEVQFTINFSKNKLINLAVISFSETMADFKF